METDSRKSVDDSLKYNADNASGAGLEVRVTRIYDGVGVNHGKSECQWCLDRCGEDMPLETAYEIGAFQRHPGCGCTIEYTSKKSGKSYQNGKSGSRNWVSEKDLQKRVNYGLNGQQSAAREERIRRTIKPPTGDFTLGEPLRRTVGAWSFGNFDIDNPLTGERIKFVPGSRPIYPKDHLLAGKGTKEPIRIIDTLLEIGGKAEDWVHEKAYFEAYDDYGSEAYVEIHWFECEGVPGKILKRVRIRDDECFFYDIKEWERKWKW